MKSLQNANVENKNILVRLDLNVPLKNGQISDSSRIQAAGQTLEFLREKGAAQIHILTHLGRPKSVDPKYSTEILVPALAEILGEKVEFRSFDQDFKAGKSRFQLHENVRFQKGEKENDPKLSEKIVQNTGAEIFVNDGFAVCHRAHASVVGVTKNLPAFGGFLIEKEIESLSPFLSNEKIAGMTVVIGGAKIETKIGVLRHFAQTAENIIVGGAIANTFLAAEGFDLGGSFFEPEKIEIARDILAIAEKNGSAIHQPIDVICADEITSQNTIDLPLEDVCADMKIFDAGAKTIASYQEILAHSRVIIWNGPIGCFETPAFENGTREILNSIAKNTSAKTILGGGDTLAALKKFGVSPENFTHVSTGGGAMLEFLEGKSMPGIIW